jgi:DNA-binding NtrC family response regulator
VRGCSAFQMSVVESQGAVLVVDDDADTLELLRETLTRKGFTVQTASNGVGALEAMRGSDLDLILADVELGDMNGLELCARRDEIQPDTPVIVITGHRDTDTAIGALRAGAYDFLSKPIAIDSLVHAAQRAIRHRQLSSEVQRLRMAVEGARPIDSMIGESASIARVTELVQQVASSDASVLVTGDSGTGKELVARALHNRSQRADAPFVAINCAAMPPALLESELFGHVRGAFTDAKRDRPGLFIQAGGGTLFLDEIGEMPLEMQAKLLRSLQERTVRPVGGDTEMPFDARLVSATNRDLEAEVEEGRFRSDLFYRINVVHIHVPPLRARGRDILLLAQRFLERIAQRTGKPVSGISTGAAQKLLDYDWPGNVRELENCMERAVALTRLSEITAEDLPEKIRTYQSTTLVIDARDPDELITLAEMELRYIQRVLAAVGGNKTQAAKLLGLDRRSLYRRLERLERGTVD